MRRWQPDGSGNIRHAGTAQLDDPAEHAIAEHGVAKQAVAEHAVDRPVEQPALAQFLDSGGAASHSLARRP